MNKLVGIKIPNDWNEINSVYEEDRNLALTLKGSEIYSHLLTTGIFFVNNKVNENLVANFVEKCHMDTDSDTDVVALVILLTLYMMKTNVKKILKRGW